MLDCHMWRAHHSNSKLLKASKRPEYLGRGRPQSLQTYDGLWVQKKLSVYFVLVLAIKCCKQERRNKKQWLKTLNLGSTTCSSGMFIFTWLQVSSHCEAASNCWEESSAYLLYFRIFRCDFQAPSHSQCLTCWLYGQAWFHKCILSHKLAKNLTVWGTHH